MIKAFVFLTIVVVSLGRPGDTKVDLKLQRTLADGQNANIFVKFEQGTSNVLRVIKNSRFSNREVRIESLTSALEVNAAVSQAKVIDYLKQLQTVSYKSIWITNDLYIRNADSNLISHLEKFSEIKDIRQEEIISLVKPKTEGPVFFQRQFKAEWGIEKIQAEEAMELLRNSSTNTQEIRVATIDTGVRGTHEALRDNYLGQYGWFDPYEQTELPNDQNGLGTHTTATIAGKGGVGVYPDAKWMACKGCSSISCTESALLECSMFVTCPTLADGSAKDCSKAPHLVSNSWGGGQGNWFDDVIEIWQAAKIVPFFSVGGSGPNCGTVGSPAVSPGVIAVASTTLEDSITSVSGRGPAGDLIKPDVTAPGQAVMSAYNTADNAYISLSGTSVATPHVAGLTAILLAYNSELNYTEVQQLLFTGAETEPLKATGQVCSDQGDAVFPNNVYGYGRINALLSLKKAIEGKDQ